MLLAGVDTKETSVESEGCIVLGEEGADDGAVESGYGLEKREYESSTLLLDAEERSDDFMGNLGCDRDRLRFVDEK
jgi:hypothetical protein